MSNSSQTRRNQPPIIDQPSTTFSILCRICYDADSREELITPCRCKGTVAYVHRSCLETWLAEANATTCELCHQVFRTERTPKYTTGQSLWRWLRYQPTANEVGRGIIGDLLACAAITPMAVIITYVCLFSSDYYNQKKFKAVNAAKWTSVSLLVMIGVMLIGYYMWVFSIIKMHVNVWYNWWQRECIVRYIPSTPVATPCIERTTEVLSDTTLNVEIIDVETVEPKVVPIPLYRPLPRPFKKTSGSVLTKQMLSTIEEGDSESVIIVVESMQNLDLYRAGSSKFVPEILDKTVGDNFDKRGENDE